MEDLVKKLEEQISFLQNEISQISDELYSQQKEVSVLKKQISNIEKRVNELLETHLIRRKVDPRVLDIKNSEGASGGTIRQISELKEGISQENAKKVIGDIKKLKIKIQIKIQGEELRVEGKKRDDLQDAIAAIKTIDIGLPIEFINFRD